MKNLSEIFKGIGRAWKSLSSVDVPDNQEYRFKGELALAQEAQAKQQSAQESLINSIRIGDEGKDTIKGNTTIGNKTHFMKIEPRNPEINRTTISKDRDMDI